MARLTDPARRKFTVADLQRIAEAEMSRLRRPQRLTRAARLHLVNQLSRRGGMGLWIIAAVAAGLVALAAPAAPLRAAVWAAMTFAAFLTCRRLLQHFSLGEDAARRPFGWRADYTAALMVLGAAYGAGAFLLSPILSGFVGWAVFACMGASALAAGAAHASHGLAAASITAPPFLFLLFAAARAGGAAEAAAVTGAAALGAALLFGLGRKARRDARLSHPMDPYQSAAGLAADDKTPGAVQKGLTDAA